MRKHKRKVGIATVLSLTFGGLVAISLGALLFLSLGNALETTRNTLATRLEALIYEAAQQSEAYFQVAEARAMWLAQSLAAGEIDPEKVEEFNAILVGTVSSLPQISAISYQYPDGSGFFYEAANRKLHQVNWPRRLQVRLNRSQTNPQTAPPSKGVWVLRPSVLDGKPASTFIMPARTPQGDIGVVAVRIDLEPLSKMLADGAAVEEPGLVRFILFEKQVVVAHPELQKMGEIDRPTIDDINDPFLKALDGAERFDLSIVGEIEGVESFAIDVGEESRVFALMRDDTRVTGGGEITIGVHFDPRAGEAEIRRLLNIAVIGVALLLGSIILAIFLGRRAAYPLQELADAAGLVEENKLDKVKPLRVGFVKEQAMAATAFNEMVSGMKDRAKIRNLFGKYVPQDVATMLLADENGAEPRNVEATVLFLDLVGFSSISERLTPTQVVETMNAFFSDAVRLIEEEHGMVTQFQGDAILAVFNVPIENEDHANAAIRTAISIFETVTQKEYAGHKLKCRMGINTGPLVAGAIGAKDRLSYTVYGDAVNVAARLEQMNKEHGTSILLGEPTVDLVKENYDFNKIGKLPIRGRNEPVDVFTMDVD